MSDELFQAAEAHQEALVAQQVMRDAASARDAAVRAAHEAGCSAVEIAKALGVNRQRVYQMISKEKP